MYRANLITLNTLYIEVTDRQITISSLVVIECELNWTGAPGQGRSGEAAASPPLAPTLPPGGCQLLPAHWPLLPPCCCKGSNIVLPLHTPAFWQELERGNLPLSSITTITPTNELEAAGIFPSPKLRKWKQRHFLLPFNTADRKDKCWH